MQIKLGEKIKELRNRDGRKQEDVANALGVTNQAISRWEANGGYPDMQMIPAIANYFHITIDELFGYNNDRNIKLKAYMDQADQLLNNDEDLTACIELLRNALSEFPSEFQVQIRLADALNRMGFQKNGIPNVYWKEAASIYEEVLKQDRRSIIPLISLYSLLGENENAERTAMSQQTVELSREVLLSRTFDDVRGDRYRGEAILALLHELKGVIRDAVVRNDSLLHSAKGLEILLSVGHLYESIFYDGSCGKFHSDLCMLNLSCTTIAANLNDYNGALRYFDSAFEHFIKFEQRETNENYFATPLLSEVNIHI